MQIEIAAELPITNLFSMINDMIEYCGAAELAARSAEPHRSEAEDIPYVGPAAAAGPSLEQSLCQI